MIIDPPRPAQTPGDNGGMRVSAGGLLGVVKLALVGENSIGAWSSNASRGSLFSRTVRYTRGTVTRSRVAVIDCSLTSF